MAPQIQIGDRGKTLGPLKPMGRISVNGRVMEASSDGAWIDRDADVLIVGGNMGRVIVKECSSNEAPPSNSGKSLPTERVIETTPLHSPPAWVERIPAVSIGLAIGIVVVPVAWVFGIPMSVYAATTPLSGAIAGWLFRVFVGTAIQSAGPREDHRPRARGIALFIVACALIGSAIGVNVGLGFLGLSLGISLGALVGGMLVQLGWILSSV